MKITTTILLHPFNGLFSRTTWARRYQKGKTSLDLNEARDDGDLKSDIWWHQVTNFSENQLTTVCQEYGKIRGPSHDLGLPPLAANKLVMKHLPMPRQHLAVRLQCNSSLHKLSR